MNEDKIFLRSSKKRSNGKNAKDGNGTLGVARSASSKQFLNAERIYVNPPLTVPESRVQEHKSNGTELGSPTKLKKSGNMKKLDHNDLADHFLSCAKMGRYLTIADNSRFIITDDFRTSPIVSAASAMAAIYSRDYLVAQAALLPLSEKANRLSSREFERFDRLFSLIEEQALSNDVRSSAQAVREGQFRVAEIKALEAALGDRLTPARLRYRQFLETIKKLIDRKITAGPFLDEFRGFTQDVAGKLDFGIYSFCLDRLFGSVRVPIKVKKLLVLELLKYPPLIRRELLSNILIYPGQVTELIDFVRYMATKELGKSSIIEIELLEAFKSKRLSIGDIETSLARNANASR